VEYAVTRRRESALERRKAERRHRHLADLAYHDPLTGLYNRRYLEESLRDNRWQNDRRQGVACAMLDIDHFKGINDAFGHKMGDAVLKETAQVLGRALGSGDAAARWGGEEFVLFKPCPTAESAWLWADSLRRVVESHPINADGKRVHVTVSIGLVHVINATLAAETIELADKALYLAKALGRNTICTGDMVVIDEALNKLSADAYLDAEQRRGELLRLLDRRLGPTQREHLTRHSELVSDMAGRLATLLDLPANEVKRIRLAGLFHDIGKCMIPESLLAKPRTLSVDEMSLMRHHARLGEWIAERLCDDKRVSDLIRSHHRRYDERVEDRIDDAVCDTAAPRGAGILSVADALVTMLSNRRYRASRPVAGALQELRRERGRQFAPDAVDAAHFLGSFQRPVAA
jgi:diguanylate cyclase (GGDEF)-like protein/putative nucleotidyltransferase with HDIG domain